MYIIEESVHENLREKGSKFLGFLFPCRTLEEFDRELHQIKILHPTATHHCYAYRINPANITEFSSDDGEPSGTAGLPILYQLKSAELVNVGAVIVRYFGGTKLGKAGLIETYGASAELVTQKANTKPIIAVQEYEIVYPYHEELIFSKMAGDFQLIELQASYTDIVCKRIACEISLTENFEKYHETVKHRGIELTTLDKTYAAQ